MKGKSRYRAPKLDSYRPRYSSASRTKRFEILELQNILLGEKILLPKRSSSAATMLSISAGRALLPSVIFRVCPKFRASSILSMAGRRTFLCMNFNHTGAYYLVFSRHGSLLPFFAFFTGAFRPFPIIILLLTSRRHTMEMARPPPLT